MKKNVILYIRGIIRRKGTNIPIISDYNHRQSVNRAEINNAKLILEKDNIKLFKRLKKRYDASEITLYVSKYFMDEVLHIGNKKNKKLKPYKLAYKTIVLSPVVWEVFYGPGLSERVITDNTSKVFSCSKETSEESNIEPDSSNTKEENKSVEPTEDIPAKPEKKFFIINHRGIVLNAFHNRDYAAENAKSIIDENIKQDIDCITNPSFLSLFIVECDNTEILETIHGIILCSHGYNVDDMHCDFKFAATDNIKKTEILKEAIKAFYRYKVDANATNDELDLAISKIIEDCLAACLTLEQIFFIVCHEMGHQKMYKLYHAEKDLNSNTKEETTNSTKEK